MPDNSPDASKKGSITSRGSMLLPKHVFRRLLSTRHRPSPPSQQTPSKPAAVTNGSGTTRKYPASRAALTSHGILTPAPDILPPEEDSDAAPKHRARPVYSAPFHLLTGYATFAKRASRPFPPPFLSTPSSSFSDPLTTHSAVRDRRPAVDGEFILGATNGDDAVFVTENCLVVNDGVGAWAAKQRGHAALWSRLIGHFWLIELERWMEGKKSGDKIDGIVTEADGDATEIENNRSENAIDASENSKADADGEEANTGLGASSEATQEPSDSKEATETLQSSPVNAALEPDPVTFLQVAFEKTKAVTKQANDIVGTTTFVSALLHEASTDSASPLLYVTVLGDCTVLIIRPSDQKVIYRSKEQWHWFDCPRQLGTNSPDTPKGNAVMEKVEVAEGDLAVAVSDGVIDNLWEHEICEVIYDSLQNWQIHQQGKKGGNAETPEQQSSQDNGKGNGGDQRYFKDHPVVELQGDDEAGMVFAARELVRCARVIAEDSFAESPFMERAVEEGLPFEGGKMDDITVAIGRVTKRGQKRGGGITTSFPKKKTILLDSK